MKILPCPFCGGKAVVDKYPVRGYEPAISFEVRCSSCNQKRVRGYFDTVYKSEKWARSKAIEAWNNRPSPWHTGEPTRTDCLYLVRWYNTEDEIHQYSVLHWHDRLHYWYDEETPSCLWGDEDRAEVLEWMPFMPSAKEKGK